MCMSRSSAVAHFLALLLPLGLSVSMIVMGKCPFGSGTVVRTPRHSSAWWRAVCVRDLQNV